jgi:glyoxylate utilization-related uncharacterized protein
MSDCLVSAQVLGAVSKSARASLYLHKLGHIILLYILDGELGNVSGNSFSLQRASFLYVPALEGRT